LVRRVLEGIEWIHWTNTTCLCFVGSMVPSMRYLSEDVTNDYVMGISGGAFKIFWELPWSPANCDLLLIGEEPVGHTFDSHLLRWGITTHSSRIITSRIRLMRKSDTKEDCGETCSSIPERIINVN